MKPSFGRDLVQGLNAKHASPRFSTGYGDIRHLPTVLVVVESHAKRGILEYLHRRTRPDSDGRLQLHSRNPAITLALLSRATFLKT
jgi:hypothetical protein